MANSYQPICVGLPKTSSQQLTNTSPSALTRSDGVATIATDIALVFTAAATYGSYLSKVRLSPYATTAATATTATVIRLYISQQSAGATTATNTWLIHEIPVASQTAAHSTNGTFYIDVAINMPIGAGLSLLVSQHAVAAASTGWQVTAFYGDFVATP